MDIMNESKLNCEKIWKIQKKGKLNSEKIWKIQKKRAYIRHHHQRRRAATAALLHRILAAVAIALKFHPKHVTNKNKTKHIMKISHINVNMYDKTATSQQNSD